MKLRPVGRFSTAVSQICEALGYEECAAIVQRSVSLIRKWADPDLEPLPNLRQGLALDAAYVAAGHGDAPLMGVYLQRLRQLVDENEADPPDVIMQTLRIQALTGQLSAAVASAIDPGGEDGPSISAKERDSIMRLAEQVRTEAEALYDSMSDVLEPLHV